MTYMDVRQKRCAKCGGLYLPPGAGSGMCSDGCWVASRGRQLSQGEQLSRAWIASADRAERRVAAGYRVNRMLADATAENDIKRYRQVRREMAGIIERAQGRSRGEPVISRSYAPPADCQHCQDCGFTPEQSRSVHAGWDMRMAARDLNAAAGDTSYPLAYR